MTVPSGASYADRNWTGVETSFNPNFRARAPQHVHVRAIDQFDTETELTYGVHYSAELDAEGNVSVIPIALPTAPLVLRIYRVTPAVQPTNFQNLVGFDAATHTARHDEAAMRDAELARDFVWADDAVVAGFDGWSPILAVVSDGARRVHQVADWVGGEGSKPPVGQYIGAAGYVAAIASGVDIRGAAGAPGAGTGDVIGTDTATGAMQWAFYSDAGGKNLRGGETISPAQIVANTDNYNPANLATALHLRVNSDAARDITGIAAPAVDLRPLLVGNTGAFSITLKDESASSTAANRFSFGGVDLVVFAGDHATLIYDLTLLRWVAMGPRRMQPIAPPQGRLTLTSLTPVMSADALAAVTVYYTPFVGDQVPLWNGSVWSMVSVAELALALDLTAAHTGYHQSGKNFDCFVFDDAGTRRLGSGPAWTSDTARGAGAGTTEIARKNGIWTNAASITLRFGSAAGNTVVKAANQATYVGSFRTSADGQTTWVANPAAAAGGGNCKLFVSNAYNRVRTSAVSKDNTNTWTYSTATWRSANNNPANRVSALFGLAEDAASAIYNVFGQTTVNTDVMSSGVGLDVTNNFTGTPGIVSSNNSGAVMAGHYDGIPGIGLHFFQAVEFHNAAGGAGTWYGDNNVAYVQMALTFTGQM